MIFKRFHWILIEAKDVQERLSFHKIELMSVKCILILLRVIYFTLSLQINFFRNSWYWSIQAKYKINRSFYCPVYQKIYSFLNGLAAFQMNDRFSRKKNEKLRTVDNSEKILRHRPAVNSKVRIHA